MKPAPPSEQELLTTAAQAYNQQDFDQALRVVTEVLEGDPDNVEALNLAGACARRLRSFPQAEYCFKQALKIRPDFPDVCSNLGNLYRDQQRFDEAETAYRQALALDLAHRDALFHLGSLCQIRGRNEDAAESYRQLLALHPDHIDAHYNLGLLLQKGRRFSEALASFQHVLDLKPERVDAHTNIGNILVECGRLSDATRAYRYALELAPDSPDAHYNLGLLLEKQSLHAEALVSYQAALNLRAGHGPALWKQAHMRRYLCEWHGEDAVVSESTLQSCVNSGAVGPFELFAIPEIGAVQQLNLTRGIAKKWGLASLATGPAAFKRGSDKRLRIGYLSADFHDHATMRLLAGVLEGHDSSHFLIHAYSYGATVADAARQRVQQACERFVDVAELSDAAAAELIRADGIDILVDLKGFTAGSRQGISARRPAPLTVSWLGYPGTLGVPELADYLIGDPVVTPLAHASHFAETLALMPYSYQPNDRSRTLLPVPRRQDVGLPDSGVVFCSFNQSYKLNAETFDVWCRLLRAVPDSVLWLLEPKAVASHNLRKEAKDRGLDPGRLIFAPNIRNPLIHLQRLQCADLALDTSPYGSHTTGSDALWAGVPLLTRIGETFASRVAASLLHAAGLPELVTQSWEEYFSLGKVLAQDKARLAAIKTRLSSQRLIAPLFDTARFTRDLEQLYLRMWQNHKAGNKQPIVLSDNGFK